MLISFPIIYLEISIIVLKKVNFSVMTLYLWIKKKEKTGEANYRSVSILPNLSKIYENIICQQLRDYFDSILLSKQCGFRKGYSATNLELYSLTFLNHLIA